MNDLQSNRVVAALNRKVIQGKLCGFRTVHRNILNYLLFHANKYPGVPCAVKKSPVHHTEVYIKAIALLESRGLITVDRPTDDYRDWTMLPTSILNNDETA